MDELTLNPRAELVRDLDDAGSLRALTLIAPRRGVPLRTTTVARDEGAVFEVLRDVGQPELQTDNRMAIAATLSATTSTAQGCATQPGRSGRSSSPLLGLSAATICALLLRRRRRAAQ